MVTDPYSLYTSPAGKECTLAAGRFSGVNPSSTVLDLGCGLGEAASTLAMEFRCRVTAVDSSRDNIEWARKLAESKNISHLISFDCQDITIADYQETPFELVLAEGGILSFLSRQSGLELASSWLVPRGWFAFSDLVLLSEKIPEELRRIFDIDTFGYETEDSYRELVERCGMDVHFMCLVPKSGWDNYYAHMARRLEDTAGIFSDPETKIAFHTEIDTFYRLEGFKYIGYLFCMARNRE